MNNIYLIYDMVRDTRDNVVTKMKQNSYFQKLPKLILNAFSLHSRVKVIRNNQWLCKMAVLSSFAQISNSYIPCSRDAKVQEIPKMTRQKKDTQIWLNILEKTLHTSIVFISRQLSMFLLFGFRAYFGCVFFLTNFGIFSGFPISATFFAVSQPNLLRF